MKMIGWFLNLFQIEMPPPDEVAVRIAESLRIDPGDWASNTHILQNQKTKVKVHIFHGKSYVHVNGNYWPNYQGKKLIWEAYDGWLANLIFERKSVIDPDLVEQNFNVEGTV
jgi:hypothetical protein